ncbi:MAG: hypothetical protein ACRER2_10105, partial [Methylococcales bacterium]
MKRNSKTHEKMKLPIEWIPEPRAPFSLIRAGSKPQYTVRTSRASVDGGEVQSAGQARSLRDYATFSSILPMISRGFGPSLTQNQDIRDCR